MLYSPCTECLLVSGYIMCTKAYVFNYFPEISGSKNFPLQLFSLGSCHPVIA